MNTYNINDKEFQQTDTYKQFIEENPTIGNLKIRAYAAGGAIPIEGLKITVRKIIDNTNIIFFEGTTNNSGIIDRIQLPAPKLATNNLDIPNKTTYDIIATYPKENLTYNYKINIYEDIYVVQNIGITPNMMVVNVEVGEETWL